MRGALPLALAGLMLAWPLTTRTQTPVADQAGMKNAAQARAALDAMVQALGGQAWLTIKNRTRQGNVAAFFRGQPSGFTTEFWEVHAWPDQDRVDFSKHRDVVQFYLGRTGVEVTYKGKAPLPQEQVDEWMRWRDHSIETVVKKWLNDPRTILVYEGQHLSETHLADQVTAISPNNESVTIQMDATTHLPLSRTFQWRDPVYKDMNTDAEEYDNYHTIDGLPTPFTITRFRNDEIIRQFFLVHVEYNQTLAPDTWDIDAAVRRIKK